MRRRSDHGIGHGPGQGVDYAGNPVIDPTENVKALTEQAITRVDDMAALRALLQERDRLHINEIGAIREQHNREMRESESRRVDANRATDLAAVGTAATQASTGIQTLAAAATTTADTLRNQVAATATAAENRLAAFGSDINKRLSALELSSSEGKGKQTVADPMLERLVLRMETLVESRDRSVGKGEGLSTSWQVALGVVAIVAALYGFTRTPAIQYVPTSPGVSMPLTLAPGTVHP